MGRLDGKVAIITGGASGMGAATARRFVAEGAKVIIADVQADLGETAAREAGAVFARHDVSDNASWEAVMKVARDRFGRVDIVMNNAGIVIRKNIEEIDLESWSRLIGINLTGVMLGCQHAIRAMKQNPGGPSGAIINIASTTSYAANPNDPGYSATKGGVKSFTQAIATYCARKEYNIRCNSISPGAIHTAITDASLRANPALITSYNKMSPLGRLGKGDDIAGMALYLASDDAAYVTGADMLVDGGMLAIHPGF
jgi:NAD(P)-dependent dehydrogenase (short-subunit alcohol dehydrogenase family)